jgi:cellulose synthase/poly-beta-1,6-N-acetylglucosamine synthase-like glycosyltransferase
MLTALTIVFWVSVGAVFHSYVLYPLLLRVLASLFGRDVRADSAYLPSVGFVVPVHNEETVIRAKVENILSLDYPAGKISVWIGSDCSTDSTHEMMQSLDDPRVHLWVAPARVGKAGVLNALVPQVQAEVLVMTDANTMHRPEGLRKLVAPLADPAVGGVAGHIDHAVRGAREYEERLYRSYESRQKWYESRLHSTISAFGGYYALKKELFRPIPGNAYSNDDVLIPMNVVRAGKRMVFEPGAVSYEDATGNVAMEFRRRVRIGAGNFQSLAWLGDFLNPLRGWPWFCYVSHKATRWISPLLILTGFGSCAALSVAAASLLYTVLGGGGMLFILVALSSRIVPLRLTSHMFYFLAMNAALFAGFFRFCAGIRSAAWERTERTTGCDAGGEVSG